MPVDVVVATTPTRGQDLLSHDLEALKPALLYADTVTLLSPSALMAFGVIAEVSIEDPMQRLMYLRQMGEAIGKPIGLTDDAEVGIKRWFEVEATANRETRRRMKRSPEHRQMRTMMDELDTQWAEMQSTMYELLVAGKAAEEMVPAIHDGILRIDDLGATAGDDLIDQWVVRLDDAMLDSSQYLLFDGSVASLIRAKVREEGAQQGDRGAKQSRQIGLAAAFLQQLPTFQDATVDQLLALRGDVTDAIVSYRAVLSEMAEALQADLHDEEFAAHAQARWTDTVAPALEEIRQAAKKAGLLRITADTVGPSKAAWGLAVALVTGATGLPEAVLAAGGMTAAGPMLNSIRVQHRDRHEELRANHQFILLHDVQRKL